MAARENQGLQIALIIFVMLTIVLSVSTFFLFRSYEEEWAKANSLQAEVAKSQKSVREAVDETTEMKQLIGVGSNETKDAVRATYKKDMDAFGKTYPEAKQNYRNLVDYLSTQMRDVNARLIDRDSREQELSAKIKKDEETKTTTLAQYDDNYKKTQEDADSEHGKFNQDRDKFKLAEADLAKKLDDKRSEFDKVAGDKDKEITETTTRLKKVLEQLDAITIHEREKEESHERADGKITWVNQRTRIVWINLGQDDGLRRQISFSVIGRDENNPLKADNKGSVEVTRLLDHHLAEAKILDDDPANPILPGDQVFSPSWQPGRAEHFALVGFMDIDGDGLSDRPRIRDLITTNGGVIDLELTDEGKKVGDLAVATHYLVLGERPSDKSNTNEFLTAYSKIIGEAKTLPIKSISVRELLDYIGYGAQERTVPLGASAKAKDFKPRPPEGVQRKSSNNMFKARKAKGTHGEDTAY